MVGKEASMKRRLYFLLPDVRSTKQVVDELLLARVEERHMHVMGRDEDALEGLPKASLFQKSDLVHGIELGLGIGGLTGALAGLVSITIPALAAGMSGGLVLAFALAGAVIGAWAAGMIGADAPNSRLRGFGEALSKGQLLLMVDVPKNRVEEVSSLVRKHHPEAGVGGTEPTIPAFP
jgi:hypothetical protein